MANPKADIAAFLPLKPLEASVLLVLADREDYGYGIVKRLAEEPNGGIRLAPSNLYYVLDRMLKARLVEESDRQAGAADVAGRRAYYRISALGVSVLAAEAARLSRMVRTAERLQLVPEDAP